MRLYEKNDAIPATRKRPDSGAKPYESELKPFGTRPLYAIHDLEVVTIESPTGTWF